MNNNSKGLAVSIAFHVAVLAVCFMLTFSATFPKEELETGGIVINYGTTDEGSGTDMTSMLEPGQKLINTEPVTDPNRPNSPETVPNTTDPNLITQDNDADAPEVKTGKAVLDPNQTLSTDKQTDKPAEPTVDNNAMFKRNKNTTSGGGGGGDGTSNKTGNQGARNGDPNSTSYTGNGGTGGNGISLDLDGRRFLSKPTISDDGQTSGKVVVKITVDKAGNIKRATAGGRGTTITNNALWLKCEAALKNIKLNSREDGPDEQIGNVVFTFILN